MWWHSLKAKWHSSLFLIKYGTTVTSGVCLHHRRHYKFGNYCCIMSLKMALITCDTSSPLRTFFDIKWDFLEF